MSKYKRFARIQATEGEPGVFSAVLATEGEASDGHILSIKGGKIPDRMPFLPAHFNDPSAILGSLTHPTKDLNAKPPRLHVVGQIEMDGVGLPLEIRQDIAHMIEKRHLTGMSVRWDEVDGKPPTRRVNLPKDHPAFVDEQTEKSWRKRNGLFFGAWEAKEGSIVPVQADREAITARADETTGNVSTFWRGMLDNMEEPEDELSRPDVSGAGPEKGKSGIQSMLFSKKKSPSDVNGGDGWTKSAAASWLKDHDMNSSGHDETDENHRFRQFNPEKCAPGSYKMLTENFPVGVQAVSCKGRSDDDGELRCDLSVALAALRAQVGECREAGAHATDLNDALWEALTREEQAEILSRLQSDEPESQGATEEDYQQLAGLLERLEAAEQRLAAIEERRVEEAPPASPEPEEEPPAPPEEPNPLEEALANRAEMDPKYLAALLRCQREGEFSPIAVAREFKRILDEEREKALAKLHEIVEKKRGRVQL